MKEELRKTVVDNMKHLGVYRDDYEYTIDVYIDMLLQYKMFEKQFTESGYKITDSYTNKAGATNDRKKICPCVKNILVYLNKHECLNFHVCV